MHGGPCLEALRTGRSVVVADQTTDARWGEYARRARQRPADDFADRASVSLTVTIRRHEQDRTARRLEEAMASRTLINQAIGVLMAEQHCDAHVAFDLLRRRSQARNRTLREVAEDLITRVSGAPPVAPAPFETDPTG